MKVLGFLILTFLAIQAGAQDLNYTPHDSIFFEYNTMPLYLDPSPGNLWQIGIPQKTWLGPAYSPPKAIVTDTINPYPPGNTSSFTFVIDSNSIYPWSGRLATYLSFIHKFDTDTINDYGMIEASIDGGVTWCDLSEPWCLEGYLGGPSWWERDSSITSHQSYPHLQKISGRSDGWIFSRFHIDYAVSKINDSEFPADSIMIRFTFNSSNNATGHEGWLIDNIIIGVCDIYVSAPTLERQDYSVNISPNPLVDRSVIKLPYSTFQNTDILVYDETGRKIRTISGKQGDIIPLFRKDFSPGIYLLKIQNGEEKPVFGKFLVQ
jgi:hypothetical protein